MTRAVYDCGPVSGLRVYLEGKDAPILHIMPAEIAELRKIGQAAYGVASLRLVVDGEEYPLPARRLAEDILALLNC